MSEAPNDAVLSGASVAENAASGTVVGTVTGVDPDAGAVLGYGLVDDAGGRFAIDASTGVVTVAAGAVLDYEVAAAHAITVRVTDQDGLSYDRAFTIELSDVNEAPTAALLSGSTIAEHVSGGTVVGTVAGSDPDAGTVLSYTLLDDAGGRFAIDTATGVVTVADGADLDYEASSSHAIIVQLTDHDGLTYERALAIAVANVNEAPRATVLSGGTVIENSANGTVVGTVVNRSGIFGGSNS